MGRRVGLLRRAAVPRPTAPPAARRGGVGRVDPYRCAVASRFSLARWTRIWWSVNEVNGTTFSDRGMWQPTHPVARFALQGEAATASIRIERSFDGAPGPWQARQRAS